METLTSLPARADGPRPEDIKNAVRKTMLDRVGIVRTEQDLRYALSDLDALLDEWNSGLCLDKPVDRVRALEAMSFIMAAKAVSFSSLARTESRGAHWRDDYPIRKDDNRSEEHTSELPSIMRIPYAAFCLNTPTYKTQTPIT